MPSLGNTSVITPATQSASPTVVLAGPSGSAWRRVGLVAVEGPPGTPIFELFDGATAVGYWMPTLTEAVPIASFDGSPTLRFGQSLRVRGLAGAKVVVSYTDYTQ